MSTQKVIAPPAGASLFLVVSVKPGHEDHVRQVLDGIKSVDKTVGFRNRFTELLTVVGIGSGLWDRMLPDMKKPKHLHPFIELESGKHKAPSTPGDLLFHFRAGQRDLCFEAARITLNKLGDAVTVEDETDGFAYFDQRDLLGFVDGTENPLDEQADKAALIPASEDPDYAGGSYVHVQKYLHDLDAWNQLTTEEQETVVGRTKIDNIEIEDKPANSHVAVNVLSDVEKGYRRILRQNMPFGSPAAKEFGTYFIGYSHTPWVVEEMLRRMFIGKPEGNYDRILDFSTAVTGGLFFVPPLEVIDSLER